MLGFRPSTCQNHRTGAFEYYKPADNEAIAMGEALVLSAAGRATKCAATTKPMFIAMKAAAASATPTEIPVLRVLPDMEFEVPLGAVNGTPAAVIAGTLLTLHTDGLSCSYVTTNGVFTLSQVPNAGNAVVGDLVRGYFR